MDCVCERLKVAPEGCLTLKGFPRLELPVLPAEDELEEDTEDTPDRTDAKRHQTPRSRMKILLA